MQIVKQALAAQVLPDPETGAHTLRSLELVFGNVLSAVVGFAGVALFVMLVLGGFKYATAGQDPNKAEAAKKTITTAIVGLVFIVLSYLVLKLLGTITGVNLTEFRIFQFTTGVKRIP